MKFYVINTLTGKEDRIKKMLERAIKEKGMEDYFGSILIPKENVVRIKKAKRVIDEKKIYPGYIVVEMELNEETARLVNSIPGVVHFLGGKKPLSLSESEVEDILSHIEKNKSQIATEAPFQKGESVKIVAGPFSGFIGIVDYVNSDREKVRVIVTIFGRPTPIEFSFLEVQPI